MKKFKSYYVLIWILVFIAFINTLFYFFGAEGIVSAIGVENTYLVIFLIAVTGGLSSLTGIALFTSIATFAAGGAEPFLLAMVGGVGIFISDSIFYFLIYYGRKSVPENWEETFKKIEEWIEKYPNRVVLTGMYFYISFSPLPNDLLMAALVIGGYSYKRIVWVLLAGSFTVAFITAYLGKIILG